jgi:hypothetical protein
MMKIFVHVIVGVAICNAAHAANIEPGIAQPATVSNPQLQMSEDPKMKAEGERLAALMEKLQKESDPEARRKIMSEVMCPQ